MTWKYINLSDAKILINDLYSLDAIKTWSLIVTMFGDLDQSSNASMSGKQINTILGHIGIKPEATRVALHRLKKDGWINTTKVGREVIYTLSQNGKTQTNAAYEDVYRVSVKFPDGWSLSLYNDKEINFSKIEHRGILLSKNVLLEPITNTQKAGNNLLLEFDRCKTPIWFEEQIVPRKILDSTKRFNVLAQQIPSTPKYSSQLDCNAMRLLFLHHWRKMALRDGTWAHIWLSNSGPVAECHKQIVRILNLLPKMKAN